jgi:hypothetical protein
VGVCGGKWEMEIVWCDYRVVMDAVVLVWGCMEVVVSVGGRMGEWVGACSVT